MKKAKKRTKKVVKHLATSPNRKSKKAKSLKWVAISVFVLLGLSLVTLLVVLFVVEPNAKKQNIDKDELRREILQTSAINYPKGSVIDSTLGFRVEYDSAQLDAQGQVTDPQSTNNYVFGETFEKEELNEARPYSIVKFRFKDTNTPQDYSEKDFVFKPLQPELSVTTNIRKDFWDKQAVKPENQGLSKIDMAVNFSKGIASKSETTVISETKEIKIGDITYKTYEQTSKPSTYGIESSLKSISYITVQNDRPYIITISMINDSNESQTRIYESIIAGMEYKPLGENTLAQRILNLTEGNVAAATTEDLPESTTNTPYDIAPETIIDVILKNQPSVVRVATFYCANIDLLTRSGSVGTNVSEGCNAAVGSGSLISSDGYIATNGHVVTITPSLAINGYINLAKTEEEVSTRLFALLDYLVSIGAITSNQTDELINSARAQDPEALSVLSNLGSLVPQELIKINSEKSEFAIQTSNRPIRINSNYNGFEFNDTVISAKLIDRNFDPYENKNMGAIDYTNNMSSDVALLKADGKFPYVELGKIDAVSEGDTITAIGFPAFTDGGLLTEKSTTPPTATQGEAVRIFTKQVNEQKLVSTSVPIAQGNSGGPAFDVQGRQIGLNTYGRIDCPDLKCFGNGTAIDVAELKALISKNSINIKNEGDITDEWQKALDNYEDGDYKAAVAGFNKVKKEYPANYLSEPLSKLATSKIGSASDISDGVVNSSNLVKLIAFLAVIGLGVGAWYIVHLHNGHKKAFANTNGYSGNMPQSPQYPTQAVQNQQVYYQQTPNNNGHPTFVQAQQVQRPINQPQYPPQQNQSFVAQNNTTQSYSPQFNPPQQAVTTGQYAQPQNQPTVIQPTQANNQAVQNPSNQQVTKQ